MHGLALVKLADGTVVFHGLTEGSGDMEWLGEGVDPSLRLLH